MPTVKQASELISKFEDLKFAGEDLQKLINFAALTQNAHVRECYPGGGENEEIKNILLIKKEDTVPMASLKIMVFFLSLQKLQQSVDDIFTFAKASVPSESDILFGRVKLNPNKKYDENKVSIGCRYIQVPHIDESKLGDLGDLRVRHGSLTRFYVFADGKQIKCKVTTEEEGDRVINQLLKIVKKEWVIGTSEEHSATGKPPKDIQEHKLKGLISKATGIHVSDRHGKLYTVLIGNRAD